MLSRCRNPNSDGYREYGGRGITVCERWLSFENFLADMGERPPDTTIDRIDNDSGYEPDNCRWATRAQQANNTRRTRILDVGGERLTVPEWSARTGIPIQIIHGRLHIGWTPERAVSTPFTKRWVRA